MEYSLGHPDNLRNSPFKGVPLEGSLSKDLHNKDTGK